VKVYVVMGSTGEYSDRTEWPVKAFRDEARAKEFVIDCDREANRIQVEHDRGIRIRQTHKHDPDFRMDYTGTSYFLYEVELDDDLAAERAEAARYREALERIERGDEVVADGGSWKGVAQNARAIAKDALA
jgi:hypothetical protein